MIGDLDIRSITGPSIAEEDAFTPLMSDVEFFCAMEELEKTEPMLAAKLRKRNRHWGQALNAADKERVNAIADRDSAQRVLVRQIDKSAAVKRELAEAVELLRCYDGDVYGQLGEQIQGFIARHEKGVNRT